MAETRIAKQLAAAYHEAGHAVVATKLGILGKDSTLTIVRDGFPYSLTTRSIVASWFAIDWSTAQPVTRRVVPAIAYPRARSA